MCEIIVYPQQNKIHKWKQNIYLFLLKNVCICISFWSYCTKYNLIYIFAFVGFFTKQFFFKNIYISKKLLYFVIISKILWRWLQECHFFWHGKLLKLLLTTLALLYPFVFWTNLGSLVVKGCTKFCHIHEYKIQGWN